ncbi:MAG: PD-(D/E)XK nuclease family protein, partial [Chloroflexota bacterium]
IGLAAHSVIAEVVRRGWPPALSEILPAMAETALHAERVRAGLDDLNFAAELDRLIHLLGRLPDVFSPSARPYLPPEVWSELTDRSASLRLRGRLDLLAPPADGSPALVIDWKTGISFGESAIPLAVIGQAALGRACLRSGCAVEVVWVFLGNGERRTWQLGAEAMTEGWERVRGLAADIIADRWPAKPGDLCARCPDEECEHAAHVPDAMELGFAAG